MPHNTETPPLGNGSPDPDRARDPSARRDLTGVTLGDFRVERLLGFGGMGEVYRARDSRLQRDVALKALPDAVSEDPDRLLRFEREARLLAAINHPNIAAIYGLEEQGGARLLVMELVEGATLAWRITRGALPVDEALPIALQIAEALEAAHEKGIIHRDLKPANVKVTSEGQVKLLDFLQHGAVGPGMTAPNHVDRILGNPAGLIRITRQGDEFAHRSRHTPCNIT